MKQKREIEETICDICGSKDAYRKCEVCGRDVCQNCNIELYKKKPDDPKLTTATNRYGWPLTEAWLPPSYGPSYQFIAAMCKGCYETFIELSKHKTIIKAYEKLVEQEESKDA